MLKIGQNVTVGYPDKNGPKKPGVIYNKTVGDNGDSLYWVRVTEYNGVYHVGDTYAEENILPAEATRDNPTAQEFTVGNDVVIDGEKWKIKSIAKENDEARFVVHEFGMPERTVGLADLS